MSIYVNEELKEFHLQTKNSSYIVKILKNGEVGQLYYGKKIKHKQDFSNLLKIVPTPASVCEFEEDPIFSLENIKQDYPSYGKGDFRQPAYHIEQENGSRITEFSFHSFKIYSGKPKLLGLPATYVENEDEAKTLEIKLFDKLLNAELILYYSTFYDYDTITRSVKIINKGIENLYLDRFMSFSIDMFDSDYEMVQLSGTWARERHMYRTSFRPGIQSIESTRGASSHHQNPFLAICRKNTDEFNGEVYGFSLVYSGSFLAQIEVDHYKTSRIMMGINPFDFKWKLEKNKEFQSPEAVLVYSDSGFNKMSQIYHKFYRERLARGKYRDKIRPILINNWEATYFNFTEEKILDMAKEAKKLGIELFVLDDGWFGKRDNDRSSLGDWFEYEKKLPNGIKGLSEKIVELGLQFGLWFEPEMISRDSELFRKHPDWAIQVENRKLATGRNQFVLDMSRKEVRDYLYETISEILKNSKISYVKWDMNRNISNIGSYKLDKDRQQELLHRYILGVYELYDRLTTEFPDILFESCAGGGGRFDPGMLYYAPQGWISDDTDAIERLKIQYGTSIVYPLSSMGSHVSAVPNHQVRRVTSIETRTNVALFGTFGYELDITKMNEQEKDIIKKDIEFFKNYRELIFKGDFYRLLSPFESNETSWMVVSNDKKEAILGYYQVLFEPNPGFKKIRFCGLDENLEYEIYIRKNQELEKIGEYNGDELINFGLILEQDYIRVFLEEITENGDYNSKLFILKAK
ncbi:MAG: Alpha-galactosidase [Fusobacteriales bacterium]|jgi:alpha-galactosidase|nr:Alpha-galactosidase [Fusobacteriales bacterium]